MGVFNHELPQMAKAKKGVRFDGRHFLQRSRAFLAAVRLLGSNPVNIQTGDADIGELTIGKMGKLRRDKGRQWMSA